MSGLPVSLTNYLASPATTISAVSENPAYPVANLRTAGLPFSAPYRTTAADGSQVVTWDYGTARPVEVWAFGRLNFSALTIQADDAITFNSAAGSPQFSQAITASEALNSRIHGSYRPPSAVTRRFNRAIIANQFTVATVPHAAGAGFYLAGWFWAGPLMFTPHHILDNSDLKLVEPVDDVPLPSGQRSRSSMGYPYLTLAARMQTRQSGGIGLDTELRAWLTINRLWGEGDIALVLPSPNVPADAYIVRRLDGASVTWGGAFSEGGLTLEEVAQ